MQTVPTLIQGVPKTQKCVLKICEKNHTLKFVNIGCRLQGAHLKTLLRCTTTVVLVHSGIKNLKVYVLYWLWWAQTYHHHPFLAPLSQIWLFMVLLCKELYAKFCIGAHLQCQSQKELWWNSIYRLTLNGQGCKQNIFGQVIKLFENFADFIVAPPSNPLHIFTCLLKVHFSSNKYPMGCEAQLAWKCLLMPTFLGWVRAQEPKSIFQDPVIVPSNV